MTSWAGRLLLPGLIALGLFVLLALVVRQGPLPVDRALAIRSAGDPLLLLVRLLNRLASAPVWIGLTLLAAALLWRHLGSRHAFLLVGVAAAAELGSIVSKLAVDRRVPDVTPGSWWDALTGDFLFPSAHVVRVTAVLGLLSILLGRELPAFRVWLLASSAAVVVLVGYARLASHAHLATDLVGGYLLGAACFSLTLYAEWWLTRTRPTSRTRVPPLGYSVDAERRIRRIQGGTS